MHERICFDPKVQHGKPVIHGTRVPVSRILGGLAGGMSQEEVMHEYEVSREDIQAAYAYATELIEHEQAFELAR
jgi:uncharacterized protein (DUF433 family)